MTVSTINSVAEFVTNGATKTFPFYFKFLDSRDLVVTYIDPEDVSTVLVMGPHYTVSGAGNDKGGSVTTTAVLRGPGKLIVSRDMEAYQKTSLRNQGKFLAETHEDVFDRLTMLSQQGFAGLKRALSKPFGREYFHAEEQRITGLADPERPKDAATKDYTDEAAAGAISYTDDRLLRTVRSVDGETLTQLPAVASRANKVMGFDANGQPIGVLPASGSGTELAIDLANPNDPDKGARMIGWARRLIGSASRTVETKLQDYVSPQDFGAKANGVDEDRHALNKALAAGVDVVAPAGRYTSTNTLTTGPNTYSAGRGSIHTCSGDFAYRIAGSSEVAGGVWNATAGVGFDALPNARDVSIHDVVLNNMSSRNATALNINAGGVRNWLFYGSIVNSNGYGILTNAGAKVDGMVISGSIIESKADPIELNSPGADQQNIAVTGCVLRATRMESDHGAGFAYGVAGAKNLTLVGCVVPWSRWEVVHQEDRTEQLACGFNAARNCHGDFYRGATDGINGVTGGRGATVGGNNAKSYSAGLGNCGAYLVYNANGSIPGMTLVNNRFEGFDYGILAGRADLVADGNVLDSCGTASIASAGGGFIYGSNLALSSGTLAKSSEGTYIGPILSTTVPEIILDTSAHVSGSIGTVLAGFSYRGKTDTLAAGATTPIDLCELPKLMCGRLIVRVKFGAAYIYGSADVLWDGTTLTTTRALRDQAGPLAWSGNALSAAGGKLRMPLFNSGSAASVVIDVIFNGEYYK